MSKVKNEKQPFNKKKLKYGVVAAAITVFVIAIVVFINLIAGVLTERMGLKLDLTAESKYEISQDTIDYIKGIDKDVEIAVMRDQTELSNGSMGKIAVESLAKYQQNSEYITVNYYDIEKNPDIVNKFAKNYNGEIKEGSILVSCGDRVKATTVTDLFIIDTSTYYQTGSVTFSGYKGESIITSAIMSVTDANPVNIGILSYYNGQAIYHSDLNYTVQAMIQLLDKNGYGYEEIDIISDEISPEKYNMIILPAPATDLTANVIEKLENYLYNDGNLDTDMVYIADVSQRQTPNIDSFLEVWGVTVGGNVVYESSEENMQQVNISRSSYPVAAPIATIVDETYSQGLSNTKLPVVMPASRNIELLFEANVDRATSAILNTADTTYLYPLHDTESAENFDAETVEKSSQTVMALATKVSMDSSNLEHKNNLLVIGDASFLDYYIVNTPNYNNAEFFINTLNQICGKENHLVIAEKNFEASTISITSSQVSAMQKVVVIVIPLIVAVCGIVVFIRRRNR